MMEENKTMFSLSRRRRREEKSLKSPASHGKQKESLHSSHKRHSDNDVIDAEAIMSSLDDDDDDTHYGIEVSLEAGVDGQVESRERTQHRMGRQPVIDIQEQIRWRKRLHKHQFSLSFPALQQQQQQQHPPLEDLTLLLRDSSNTVRTREHRIPLSGSKGLVQFSYLDALEMLQNSPVTDEYTAVSQELTQLHLEMKALEQDKAQLLEQHKLRTDPPNFNNKNNNTSFSFDQQQKDPSFVEEWDMQRMLLVEEPSSKTPLSTGERRRLQVKRGNCLTVHLQSYKAKEVLLSQCGATLALVKPTKIRLASAAAGEIVTLGPHNCKTGVADMQHIAMMSNTKLFKTSFFFSLDAGKAQTWGRLPPKLFRRIEEHDTHKIEDIAYLSTGPEGSYYAEFRSGECWWLCAEEGEDNALHSILQTWNVYRVVFGQMEALDNDRGTVTMTISWIVIGRDGRVAWKNLPTRLHNRLQNRVANMAAPAEVSLGPGSSYFIRFLDDAIDYCLPAEIAQVCELIERQGGRITDIALHPEISHDFMIRHTELKTA
jgi:hypothetical protein